MSVDFTFINCLIQSSATFRKTTTFSLLKTESGCFNPLHSDCCPNVSTAQTSFFHLIKCLICLPFCCTLHSRGHHSLMPHASMYIRSPTSAKFIAVEANYLPVFDTLLLSILFSNLSRLVLLNILCWNSKVANFHQVAPLCVIKLINVELRRVQNKTALKCADNYAKWFRHFKDVRSQTY